MPAPKAIQDDLKKKEQQQAQQLATAKANYAQAVSAQNSINKNSNSSALGSLSSQSKLLASNTPVLYEGGSAVGRVLTPVTGTEKTNTVKYSANPVKTQAQTETKVEEPVAPITPITPAAGQTTIAAANDTPTYNQPTNVVSYMPSTTSSSSYQIQEREKPTYTASTQQTAVQQPTYQKSDYVPTRVTASTAKFEPSQQFRDAMATVQASLDKLMSGRTSYTDKINSSLKSIEDTAPFSYDFNSDPMFQQMLAGAMKSGKLAMEDSMGQAAALTGGYGSSYSGMVGQQAYNRYIDEAYDRIPDYWGMALSEYQQDLNNKYNLLNQYRASDDTEWNRNFDTFKSQYQMASDQWDRESNTYWNEQNFKENSRQWAESENDNRNRFAEAIRQYENDRAYQQYRDSVSDQQYQQAFDYNKYRDEMSDYYNDRNYDYQLNRDAISDARYDDQTAYERAIDERNFNYNAEQDQIANNLKWANYTLSKKTAEANAKKSQEESNTVSYEKFSDINTDAKHAAQTMTEAEYWAWADKQLEHKNYDPDDFERVWDTYGKTKDDSPYILDKNGFYYDSENDTHLIKNGSLVQPNFFPTEDPNVYLDDYGKKHSLQEIYQLGLMDNIIK